MARDVSSTMDAAIAQQQTEEAFLILIELDHADLDDPLRFVNNSEGDDITSNGDVYTAYPFRTNIFPEDSNSRVPQVTLTIDNVARELVETIRNICSPISIDISVILESAPNTVEVGPLSYTIKAVNYNAFQIVAQLSHEEFLNLRFPAGKFTQSNFPALY